MGEYDKCPRCDEDKVKDEIYGDGRSPKSILKGEPTPRGAKRISKCPKCGWKSVWIHNGDRYILQKT